MSKQPMYRGKPIGGKKAKKAGPAAAEGDVVKAALRKLKELHEARLITDAEYERKRKDLLSRL